MIIHAVRTHHIFTLSCVSKMEQTKEEKSKGDLTVESCQRSWKHHGWGVRSRRLLPRESTETLKGKSLHIWMTHEGHRVCSLNETFAFNCAKMKNDVFSHLQLINGAGSTRLQKDENLHTYNIQYKSICGLMAICKGAVKCLLPAGD